MLNLNSSSLRLLGAVLAGATLATPLLLSAVVPAHVVAAFALAIPFVTMGLLEAAVQSADGHEP
jgi:hypothetical protein